MLVLDELRLHLGGPAVGFGGDLLVFAGQRADDQRRAGFVDQNAVGFVDEHEVEAALHRFVALAGGAAQHLAEDILLAAAATAEQQPVAEEVEAELLGGAVGDVAGVGLAALVLRLLALDDADRHAERFVERASSTRRRGGRGSR